MITKKQDGQTVRYFLRTVFIGTAIYHEDWPTMICPATNMEIVAPSKNENDIVAKMVYKSWTLWKTVSEEEYYQAWNILQSSTNLDEFGEF